MKALRVASHLAPGVSPLYEYLADRLADQLHRRAEFVVAESYERCVEDVDDVCFVCSIPYLLLAEEGRTDMEVIAAPILRGDRYRGTPVYFSDVIVAAHSPHHVFGDLRGGTWAYNEPFSHSGYITVLHHLVALGEDRGFFGEMVEAGFHQIAIKMVADGTVDASAIDSQVLDIELREHPDLASAVRVIETIGPSTIQPVVASRTRLSDAERQVITTALLGIGEEPDARSRLDGALVDRFVAADDRTYEDIRRMLARVRDAALVDDSWEARWRSVTGRQASMPRHRSE
jgi:phosphonate transport system substrate-binding protein